MSPTPNPSSYYRLTNHYTGPSAPLSIYRDRATNCIYLTTRTATNTPDWNTTNNEPTITPYWQILPVHGSEPPRYHICTEYHDDILSPPQGSPQGSKFLALDILNHDKTKPHLTKPGFYSGQYWSVTTWPRHGGGDCHDPDGEGAMNDIMLTNDYSGEGLHLDTYSDTKQGFLGGGDHSGQHWVLERVEKKPLKGEGEGGREVSGKVSPLRSPRRIVEPGMTVGLFAFGVGFGAAVVIALAWVELLPLLLVVGLSLGAGISLGLVSPRRSMNLDGPKQLRWSEKP